MKPRTSSAVTQELYVYHRANLVRCVIYYKPHTKRATSFNKVYLSDFQVRPAVRDDQRDILKLTHLMHPFDLNIFARDLANYMKLGKEPVRIKL